MRAAYTRGTPSGQAGVGTRLRNRCLGRPGAPCVQGNRAGGLCRRVSRATPPTGPNVIPRPDTESSSRRPAYRDIGGRAERASRQGRQREARQVQRLARPSRTPSRRLEGRRHAVTKLGPAAYRVSRNRAGPERYRTNAPRDGTCAIRPIFLALRKLSCCYKLLGEVGYLGGVCREHVVERRLPFGVGGVSHRLR